MLFERAPLTVPLGQESQSASRTERVPKIVFSRTRSPFKEEFYADLFLMDVDGSHVKSLKVMGNEPAISPDGTKIAFISSRLTELPELFVMNVDGSNVRRLTHEKKGIAAFSPTWSPDGKTIAFVGQKDKFLYVYLIDPDGMNLRQLWDNSGMCAAWSPDGKEIAVSAPEVDLKHVEIYAISADGKAVRQVTHLMGNASSPQWSPDGRKIVFVSTVGKNSALYSMNADGTDVRQLLHHKKFNFKFPTWSPDGKKIAFAVYPKDESGLTNVYIPQIFHHIWVLDLESMKIQRILKDSGSHPSFGLVPAKP